MDPPLVPSLIRRQSFPAQTCAPPSVLPCTTLGTALTANNEFILNLITTLLGLPILTIIPEEIISLEFEPIIDVADPDDCSFSLTFASTLLDGSFSGVVDFGQITVLDGKTMIVTDIEVSGLVLPSVIESLAAIPIEIITGVLDQLEQIT